MIACKSPKQTCVNLVGMLFVALMFCLPVGSVCASHLSLLVNGKAIHTNKNSNTQYNERNWGFGFEYELGNTGQKWLPFVSVSGFKDSHGDLSYYAGSGYMRRFMLARQLDDLHMDAGLIGFAMSRKDYKGGAPFLGVLPVLSLGTKDVSINVTYIPKVHPKMAELWFFQLKFSTIRK